MKMKKMAEEKKPNKHGDGDIEKLTAKDWHLYWVLKDPEFQEDLAKLHDYFKTASTDEKTYGTKKYELMRKYAFTESDYTVIEFDLRSKGIFNTFKYLEFDKASEMVKVEFSPKITYKEFVSGWKIIKNYLIENGLKTNKKRKPPENTRLLYSIFKARQKDPPITFSNIFKLYQVRQLEYYKDGNNRQFNSEDSLERFYNKYKPDNWLQPDT